MPRLANASEGFPKASAVIANDGPDQPRDSIADRSHRPPHAHAQTCIRTNTRVRSSMGACQRTPSAQGGLTVTERVL